LGLSIAVFPLMEIRGTHAMRVVAITAGHSFGDRLLRRLGGAGVSLTAVFVTLQQNAARDLPPRHLRGWLGSARDTAGGYWKSWRRWPQLATRIRVVRSLADPHLSALLVRARPDLLVLAGTGIVPPSLLRIPSTATLNAHPGLLPWVRGVCPLEHAVLRGVALGATVHAVDAGIDTGPIIRRVLLRPSPHDKDRIGLMRRLEDAAIDAFADVLTAILRGETLPLRAQTSRHSYGRWVTDEERARAVALLDQGEAHRLYRAWHAAGGSDVLPDDDALLPGPLR
jgi:methionyl-tRNA formyltransferase